MKKSFFAIVSSLLLLSFISCETTPDWVGIYAGVIPAADAEGINVKITLKTDETYTVEYQYIGKGDDVFTNTGKFNWNSEKNTVILVTERENDFPKYYKLGKNTLTQLDMTGNIITGEFANNYILKKQQ
jgi:uncharacterized lipoprotein NlpE involved in copper resistance